MKKVIIVHGWGGSPEKDWFPWLKSKLEEKSFEVFVPEMPDTMHPKIGSWATKLKEATGEIDEDTYFIGHSIGCQAILRFLEELPNKQKIGGLILVAGWINLTDETWDEDYTPQIASPWLKTPINFDKIRTHLKEQPIAI